jgi:hypothetical protein
MMINFVITMIKIIKDTIIKDKEKTQNDYTY